MKCQWYPKRFEAGDMTGEGVAEVLGRPGLDPITILVRETVQNSWDARLAGRTPHYSLDYRHLQPAQVHTLLTQVLTAARPDTDFTQTLMNDPWVFEIVDWNTTGLGGPTRVGPIHEEGVATDFVDFLLKMGARRNTELGGGSYGFGKTATYLMSSCGTIVVWTRCRENEQIQDRFMASAIGPEFAMGSTSFTGRQWWGHVVDDRPEPVIGPEAYALGSAVFDHRFGPDETGTAILVLAANRTGISDAWSADHVRQECARAILWHLWPKMVPDALGQIPMPLMLRSQGEPVPLPDPHTHPVLMGFCKALQAVRDKQSGRDVDEINTEIHEIWMHRPHRITGHLAVHRWPIDLHAVTDDSPLTSPIAGVALMRHRAEMVVRYDTHQRLPGGLQWAGVFKPTDTDDDAFTAAEPPSHDDWSPASVKDKALRRVVNVSLTRISENVPRPASPGLRIEGGNEPSVALARALADLAAPGATTSDVKRMSSPRTAAPRSPRAPRPEVLRALPAEHVAGRAQFRVELGCPGSVHPTRIAIDVRIATEGGRAERAQGLFGLRSAEGAVIDDAITLPAGEATWIVIDAPVGVAIELDLSPLS